MAFELRRVVLIMATLCFLPMGTRIAFADDADAATVSVKYSGFSSGKTEIADCDDGAKLFTNKNLVMKKFPDELKGLMFTKRPYNAKKTESKVTIDAPKGATVYLAIGDGPWAVPARDAVVEAGWRKSVPSQARD